MNETVQKSFMIMVIVNGTYAPSVYALNICGRTNTSLGEQWTIGCPSAGLNIPPPLLCFPSAESFTDSNNISNGIYFPSRLLHLIYTVNNGVAKSYINGVHIGTHNYFRPTATIADGHASTAFLIGTKRTNNQGSTSANMFFFKAACWNKVLTDNEVAGLYAGI